MWFLMFVQDVVDAPRQVLDITVQFPDREEVSLTAPTEDGVLYEETNFWSHIAAG